jgi:hypothetical protein
VGIWTVKFIDMLTFMVLFSWREKRRCHLRRYTRFKLQWHLWRPTRVWYVGAGRRPIGDGDAHWNADAVRRINARRIAAMAAVCFHRRSHPFIGILASTVLTIALDRRLWCHSRAV